MSDEPDTQPSSAPADEPVAPDATPFPIPPLETLERGLDPREQETRDGA